MVVEQSNIDHIMRGLQSTEGVRLHNHRKKLRQRFDIIKKLGQGTYGKVQLGINKETGQEVAIKTIKKCKIETEADLVRIRREIQIMSSVRHPNIIHIYEVFENREKMVLVMEYAAGGELYDFLSERKVLEETEARRIFRQISTAVYYCHKHKICHRDLKLENILLDEHGSAKIADFGLSNVFDEQRLLSTFCGSPLYASPEIVKGTPYHGPEVDCWSLGVLLYTLVYGAMPFDGSNFKRLVKQISQGDYFEPKKPSPASPLIREMLTVNPAKRATIEKICSHWWVNQGFNVSCLDIAEDLANQTPVRLDLLLSLAPPPENSDKLVVTDDQSGAAQEPPPRSMSVGSFMELDPNTEQRIRDFVAQEVPSDNNTNEKTIKRKLESGPSESSVTKGGARKKERIKQSDQLKEVDLIPETVEQSANKVESNNVVMDVDSEANKIVKDENEQKVTTDNSANVEVTKLLEETDKVPIEPKEVEKPNETKTEVEKSEKSPDAISKDKPTRKSVKSVKKKVTKDSDAEKKEESESADSKVKVKKKKKSESPAPGDEEPKRDVKKEDRKSESKEKEEIGKEIKRENSTRKSRGNLKLNISQEKEKSQTPTTPDDAPAKPMERRKSKVFETAEKFLSSEPRSPTQEKPKKVFIPGVKVSDFAKAFERRSSVTSTNERRPSVTSSKPVLKSSPSKKLVSKETTEKKTEEKVEKLPETKKEENSSQNESQTETVSEAKSESEKADETCDDKSTEEPKMTAIDDEKIKKLKESARSIISNALVEEERKKIKKQILKPPVPKVKSEDLENRKKALTLQIGKETATVQVHTPENTKFLFEPEMEGSTENKENIETPKEKKTAKVEITLKSNTLPRKTSKAEIQLASPPQQGKDSGNFRTEVEHRVGDPGAMFSTQRSEVAFPVSAAQRPTRSMSLEPEGRRPQHQSSKERIIPIQVEESAQKEENESRDRIKELERPLSQTESRTKLPYQRTLSQRSSSLSRQGTQDSDTESTVSASGEPIRKSPREFIIPIAVEGGGYITPRATSLEPSDSMSSKRSHRPFGRKISLFSNDGSEDESSFSTLQRHSSRDLDEPFRLHRLRSTRPTRASVERADSASASEEEEEDDDGFEILTAENLFSTLLSRVRSLTQRLNVEDGMRPGFPTSRLLMNHFGPSERLFSNIHQPLTRLSERPEFGRSMSRDVENGLNRWSRGDLSDSESSRSIPRGHSKLGRSESDTDSISESNTLPRKKSKTHGEKKRRSHSSSRQRSVPVDLAVNEEMAEYIPTYDGNKSLYVPSHRVLIPKTQKRNSDSDLTGGASVTSNVPKLKRTTSLKTDGPKRRPERKSIGILEECLDSDVFTEKDFYDILAEKYGITNVKRYDLTPRYDHTPSETESESHVKRRTSDSAKSKSNENRRSLISLTEVDQKVDQLKSKLSNSEQNLSEMESDKSGKKQKDILPPLPPKPKKEDFKTPSEKLAAVLNRLESNYDKTEKKPERGIPNDLLYGKKDSKPSVKSRAGSVAKESPKPELRKIESERLAELSPKALELYEKTLGLYQKTLEKAKKTEKSGTEETEKKIPESPKATLPAKVMTRHKSDMSLKDYDRYDVPTKEMLMNPEKYTKVREIPEKSVLSKYLHYSSCEDGLKNSSDQYFNDKKLKHYGSLQSKLDENNKADVEVTVTVKLPDKEKSKEKSPEKRKSVKRLSKTDTGENITKEKSPEKRKSVKTKDEDEKKRAVRIKRLSKDLENELNKMEVEKESEEVWKKREELPVAENRTDVGKVEKSITPVEKIEKLETPVEKVEKLQSSSDKTEMTSEKTEKPEKSKQSGKNKFLSSLEKKFEKFRAPDKNYVDKAIRSLRESSLGPKDVACENVLIKRAVSLSDCSVIKPVQPSRIQSTVSSVLGMFKKFENNDSKKKSTDDVESGRRTSVPTLLNVKKTGDSLDIKPESPLQIRALKQIPKIVADNDAKALENPEMVNSSRRQSTISGYGNDLSINKSSSPVLGFDDSSSFLSPDSESFDSWSNCSDFGTPDEFVPNLRTISPILKMANLDDVVGESVGDRIRRKSFYTRFNERKKPRKSAILEGRKKYDQAMFEEAQKEGSVREKHAYNRTLSQNMDKPRVQQMYSRSLSSADYSRPRPFYKVGSKSPTNETSPVYRKTSLDWPKNVTGPNFVRSVSQSSSGSNYSSTNQALAKSYLGSYDNIRMRRPESVYSPRSSDLERAFSPIRTFSPNRTLTPTFGFRRSPSTSALD